MNRTVLGLSAKQIERRGTFNRMRVENDGEIFTQDLDESKTDILTQNQEKSLERFQ